MRQWDTFEGNPGTGEGKRGVEVGVSKESEKKPQDKKATRK